jgi:NIMA (never in mitosis gene a)-related kinase
MEQYDQLDILGYGAFGVIIKVKHKETCEIRCMKKIDVNKLTQNKEAVKREVEIIQRLDHPNIIKYYEHFMDGKWFCIVMEYADDNDLEQYLKARKSLLNEDEILRIGCQIGAGLSYIHSQGIVHRDLKPGNILLCKNGLVKIGDFGLSKATTQSLLQTQVGTPAYFSPEVIDKVPYLYEVDCWALGCIFYELISRRKAFLAYPIDKLFNMIRHGKTYPLTGWYSPELFVLVEDLLKKDQHLRLSSSICVQSPVFASAFITLGIKFQRGDGCIQDLDLSKFYLDLALNSSNLKGPGWRHNAVSSKIHQLRKLHHQAEIGGANDAYKYAVSLYKGLDCLNVSQREANSLFRKGSEEKDPFMMYIYGLSLDYGSDPSPQVKAKAAELFKKAAEAGDIGSFLEYGIYLQNGEDGVPPRRKEAMMWYKKSAEAGNSFGMNNYGVSLEEGDDGLPPRKREAMMWF